MVFGIKESFRKNRSTIDPLMFLTREIQNAFALQNQTIAVLFDLEKAYDTTCQGGYPYATC